MLLGIALAAAAYEFRLDRAELSYPGNMVSQWLPADMPHGQLMWRSLESNSQIPAAVPASEENTVWMHPDLDRSGSVGFRMDNEHCNLIH
jgi:hypothetical protein